VEHSQQSRFIAIVRVTLVPPISGKHCRRLVLQSAVRAALAAIHPLARLFFEPLLRAWSAMWTARPTTGSAFTRLKVLDRALNSAVARYFLLGRNNPTDPFVPRQRRQILPCRLRGRFRAQCHVQVRRGFVHGTGLARFAFVHHFILAFFVGHAVRAPALAWQRRVRRAGPSAGVPI
jgi:hypothetical protein